MKNHSEGEQSYTKDQTNRTETYTNTQKLVIGSVLAAFAALFQSAGFFTGFGYALSVLATLPIVIAAMLSLKIGMMSYFITCLLLVFFQPSELFVFPFTTGLLGVSLGVAFKWCKHWLAVSVIGGIGLSIGILFLLYVIKFPVLGPTVSFTIDFGMMAFILIGSIIYSFIWTGFSRRVYKLIFRAR